MVEVTWFAQPRKEETEGRCHGSLQFPHCTRLCGEVLVAGGCRSGLCEKSPETAPLKIGGGGRRGRRGGRCF